MTSDALTLFASRVVAAGTTLVVLAVVARSRPPEDLGLVALGLTLGLALAIIPELGMTALYIREVVRAPARTGAMLGAMLAIRVVTLPLGILVALTLAVALAGERSQVVMLVALGPAIQQVGELGRATFLAHRRIPVASLMTIVENLLWLGVVVGALILGWDLGNAFGAADLTLVLVVLVELCLVRLVLHIKIAVPSRSDLVGLLAQAGPFAVFSALALVALRSDTIFIGLFLPDGLAVVGAYFAASRIAAVGEYVSESVGRTIFPDLARHYPGDRPAVQGVLRHAMGRALPLGILMASGLAAMSGGVLVLLYGDNYRQHAALLTALAVLIPIRFAASLAGVGLTSADAQGFRTKVLAVAVGSSTLLYLILIPVFGIVGAIVGLYVAWLLMGAANVGSMARRVGSILDWSSLGRWALIGVAAYLASRLVADSRVLGADFLAGLVFCAIAVPALWTLRRAGDPQTLRSAEDPTLG